MRLRLALAPRWVLGLVQGVLFGAFMSVFSWWQHREWVPAIVGGGVGGAMFGAFMGVVLGRLNRQVLADATDLPLAQLRVVVRASTRGPAPADSRLREAALAMVRRRYDQLMRIRRFALVVFSAMLALYVLLTATQSRWWVLGAVACVGMLVMTWWEPRRMQRRLTVLTVGAS